MDRCPAAKCASRVREKIVPARMHPVQVREGLLARVGDRRPSCLPFALGLRVAETRAAVEIVKAAITRPRSACAMPSTAGRLCGLARGGTGRRRCSRSLPRDRRTEWDRRCTSSSQVRDVAARRRREPIPMDDDGLRAGAERYRTLEAMGQRKKTQQIADERHVSRMTASRWLRRARDLGILEEPGAGRG